MKKILTAIGIITLLTISSTSIFATSKVELLNNIAKRFELAAKSFNGHVYSEIRTINQSPYASDVPNDAPPPVFMSGAPGFGGGMTCYYSDSLIIVVSADPNYKIDEKFDENLAKKISKITKNDVAEVEETKLISDKNDDSIKSAKIITVAWQGRKLTGVDNSKLVCAIKAFIP